MLQSAVFSFQVSSVRRGFCVTSILLALIQFYCVFVLLPQLLLLLLRFQSIIFF